MTSGIAERSCSLLRLPSRMQSQTHEGGLTGLATRRVGQDSINAHEIDRHCSHHVLQLRFVQAIIACTSDAHPADCLGKRPLDACSGLISLPKCRSLLFVSPRLQSLMSRLWAHMEHAARRG